TATESDAKVDNIKIPMLLASIGPDALERYNHFTFDEAAGEDSRSYVQVMQKFKDHFSGLKRAVFSRYQNDHRAATSANEHQLCRRCGTKHEARKCPAYGATCYKCNGRNHYSAVCKSKSKHAVTTPHGHDEDSSDDEFFLHSVVKCVESLQNDASSSWYS
ncbi:hypothetical protein LSAT2_022117, partial [Lamellibrachia satsuma]